MKPPVLTADLMVRAYASGIFPMAESSQGAELYWLDPEMRGVIPLDGVHISRSMRKTLRREEFRVSINEAFDQVVRYCADREETWINDDLKTVYRDLHSAGLAHSLEVWRGPSLIGGIFGIALGGAFFGESMVSRARDGSKIALIFLAHRLAKGGFDVFDTQFITDHLASLGAIEIPRHEYRANLSNALGVQADFVQSNHVYSVADVLQRSGHTS